MSNYDSHYDSNHDGWIDSNEEYNRQDFEDFVNGRGLYSGSSNHVGSHGGTNTVLGIIAIIGVAILACISPGLALLATILVLILL